MDEVDSTDVGRESPTTCPLPLPFPERKDNMPSDAPSSFISSGLSPQAVDSQAADVYDEFNGARQALLAGAARAEEEETTQLLWATQESLKPWKRSRPALEDNFDASPSPVKKARRSPRSPTSEPLPFTFCDGALRITRTPGRMDSDDANAISLPELIDHDRLVSAAIFSFFIADDELLRHLPLHAEDRQVPLHVGRDIHQDPLLRSIAQREGLKLNVNSKLTKAQFALLAPALAAEYTSRRGRNYHAFYARATGCAHSKILVLEYPDFLRLVITSANMMDLDTEHGDNSWYIHDLPRLPAKDVLRLGGDFEERLWNHLRVLGCPGGYIDGTLCGRFDFSRVRVHLVTSEPRTGKEYGTSRLRAVVAALDTEHAATSTKMEICTGSVGKLSLAWLRTFFGACTNSNSNPSNESVLPIQIVFPTRGDVAQSSHGAQAGGPGNIGSHLRWNDSETTQYILPLFAHYQSRDPGCLFHLKLYLALDASDPLRGRPHWVYVGSANLSAGAWGSAEGGPVNYECGVVIPGELLRRLRAPESRKASWESGVVPYVRPVVPYRQALICRPDGGCVMRPGRRGEYLHHDAECPVFLERPWTFNPNAVPQASGGHSASVILTVE